MSDEKTTPEQPAVSDKPKDVMKKRATKKPSTRETYVTRYRVAGGRSLTARGRIINEGEEITADEVADIEALLKGGYVVKV